MLIKTLNTNRRRGYRVTAELTVWVRGSRNGTFQQASLRDLSEGGASLSWSGGLSQAVDVVVKTAGGRYLTFTASPVWQSSSAVGLKFESSCRTQQNCLELQVISQIARSSPVEPQLERTIPSYLKAN